MNLEERIAQLEAELATERAANRRLAETLRLMCETQARLQAADAESRARRAARNWRHRHGDVSRDGTETSQETPSPSPLLAGSPPPSDPSSPPPISSPPPLSSASPPPRGELQLEPTKAPRKRQAKSDKPVDPRHAPLVKQLVEVHGWPFDGPKDAAQVTALLALADQQEATRGERAPSEVLRRAQIARAQSGFYSARTLCDFRNAWGRFEKPQQQAGTGPPPVSDWSNRPELPPPPEDDLPL